MKKIRRSIRCFTDQQVDLALIEEILIEASRSPSGYNMQPWKIYIISGIKKQKLSQHLINEANDPLKQEKIQEDSNYIISNQEPYLSKKREVGYALYSSLGISHKDRKARHEQSLQNYNFFGAPIGLFLTIDKRLGKYSWLDCGIFLQQLSQAAEDRGLGTCLQAIFKKYDRIVSEHLRISNDEELICGISLGYPDWTAPINNFITKRDNLNLWVKIIK